MSPPCCDDDDDGGGYVVILCKLFLNAQFRFPFFSYLKKWTCIFSSHNISLDTPPAAGEEERQPYLIWFLRGGLRDDITFLYKKMENNVNFSSNPFQEFLDGFM